MYFWCPTVKINGDECNDNLWENEISDDGLFIFENQKERKEGYLNSVIEEQPIRYIFTKYRDETGNMIYKFKGVFELDLEQSKINNIRVWKRVASEIDLKEFF